MGTTWEIFMKDYVSGPLKKLQEYTTGTQKKINDFSGALDKAGKASIAAGHDFKRSFQDQAKLLDDLQKRLDRSYNTKDRIAYSAAMSKITKEMEKQKALIAPKISGWTHAKEGLKDSLNEIPGVGGMMGLATNPIALGVAAVGGALYESGKAAIEFEDGMAKINATAQLGHEQLGKLGEDIKAIGSHSGGHFSEMTGAFDVINKQTKDTAVSLDILGASTKGMETGLVDLNVAGEATARMAGILGKDYKGATDVMDTFFSSIKYGNGDVNAMMQQLPHLAQLGTGVGLKFKETAGIFNYFTGVAKESASEAETDMMGMLNTLGSANVISKFKDADKNLFNRKGKLKREAISDMSLAMYNEDGTMKSFDKIIRALKLRMDEIKPDMQMDFLAGLGIDDPRKRKGILMLMKDVDGLKKSMTEANNAAGGLDEAFESSATIARKWGDVADKWKDVETNIGTTMLPVIDGWLNVLTNEKWKTTLQGEGIKEKDIATLAKFGYTEDTYIKDSKKGGPEAAAYTAQGVAGYARFIEEETKKWMEGSDAFRHKEITSLTAQKNLLPHQQDKVAAELMTNILNDAIAKLSKKTGATPGDSAASKVNNGSAGSPTGKDDTTLTSNTSGVRSLIMNVKINNTFKDGEQANAKRKLSDDLVDAARDAMVTIGV